MELGKGSAEYRQARGCMVRALREMGLDVDTLAGGGAG